VSLDDPIPASTTGALLSIADKIDTVVGVLGLGIQVTGSSDPFGLRRGVQGISKILLGRKLSLSLGRLLDKVVLVYGTRLVKPKEEVKATALEFFAGRLRYICETQGFRYDLVNAGLAPGVDNVYHAWLRVKALDGLKASPAFEPFILMAKRVNNILPAEPPARLNPGLFAEKEERELHAAYGIVKSNAAPLIAKGDFGHAQAIIFRLQPCLNAFFDKVLVMAEDKKIRQNRLALLQAIQKLLLEVADYSHVVLEGEAAGR
ncbi:MAG: glycine--tRNA ligase subunit beta, partial [Candidatus Aminicenantes bacterium]|nr:glycine--tRNA ligase subunit beta [Candidatus Aminicenantes bacterium]